MRRLASLALIFGIASLPPSLVEAGMNKCVSADGKISYSDRPCSVIAGETTAAPKDSAAFAAARVRDAELMVGVSCHKLTELHRLCRKPMFAPLLGALSNNCVGPLKQYMVYRERQLLTRELIPYDFCRNDDIPPGINSYVCRRGTREPTPDMLATRCQMLEADAWKFVRSTFRKRVSDGTANQIETHLLGRRQHQN